MKFLILLLTIGVLTSCSDECEEQKKNSLFRQLFESLEEKDGFHFGSSTDHGLHMYDFRLEESKQLCSMGYQANEYSVTAEFLFYIKDLETNEELYRDSMTFDDLEFKYWPIDPIITLEADRTYRMVRKELRWNSAWGGDFGNVFGTGKNEIHSIDGFSIIKMGTGEHEDLLITDTKVPYIDLILH